MSSVNKDPRVCSCGCTEPHVIMTRETADAVKLSIWSDGAITRGALGAYLRGLGTGRSDYARKTRARAVRLIADDVSLFACAEIPTVVRIAERTYRYTYRSETDRAAHVRATARRKRAEQEGRSE